MRYDCTKNQTKIRSKIGDVVYNVFREKVYKCTLCELTLYNIWLSE